MKSVNNVLTESGVFGEEDWIVHPAPTDDCRVLTTVAINKNVVVCKKHLQLEMSQHWLPKGEGPIALFDIMRQDPEGNCSKHYEGEWVLWRTNQAVGVGDELTKLASTDFCVYAKEIGWMQLKKKLDREATVLTADIHEIFKLIRELGEEVRSIMEAHKVRDAREAAGEFVDREIATLVAHGIQCECKGRVSVGKNCAKVLYARFTKHARVGQDVFVVDLPTANSKTPVPVRGIVEALDEDDLAVYINFPGSGTFEYDMCAFDLDLKAAVLRAQESQKLKAINPEDPIVNFWYDGLSTQPFMERRALMVQAAAVQQRAEAIKVKSMVFNTITEAPFVGYDTNDEADEEDEHELPSPAEKAAARFVDLERQRRRRQQTGKLPQASSRAFFRVQKDTADRLWSLRRKPFK